MYKMYYKIQYTIRDTYMLLFCLCFSCELQHKGCGKEFWIGLHRYDEYKEISKKNRRENWLWTDNSHYHYKNYDNYWINVLWYDEPSGDGKCIFMWNDNAKWRSKGCENNLYFMCKDQCKFIVTSLSHQRFDRYSWFRGGIQCRSLYCKRRFRRSLAAL